MSALRQQLCCAEIFTKSEWTEHVPLLRCGGGYTPACSVPQVVSKARFRHEDKFFAHLMEKRPCDKEDMRKLSVGCSIRLETDGPKTTLEGVVVA
jgi:hypothetical protein